MAGFEWRDDGASPHRAGIRRLLRQSAGGSVRQLAKALVLALCAVLLLVGLVVGPAAGSRDLPRREMNDEVFTNAKGWLVFKGNVDPGWNNRNVQIYKRLCKGCEWTLVKKTLTDGSGRWRTRIYAPRTGYWFWKGLVPKAGDYGKSVTQVYRTYVT